MAEYNAADDAIKSYDLAIATKRKEFLAGRDYNSFLKQKRVFDAPTGLQEIPELPVDLKPFQRDIVSWALRRGRAAIFAGTGLGKTYMQLAWVDAITKSRGTRGIIFSPLAVAQQTVREGLKFNIPCEYASADTGARIIVTNYQKMHHFDLSQFDAVVLDESGILKNEKGAFRNRLISECAQIPFRLAATATPSPNDFMELGNHAEFLSIMSYTDMLSMFFAHDGGSTQNWRLKGYAENAFWEWMCSWAVMMDHPKSLGYSDDGYDLPELRRHQHIAEVDYSPDIEMATLFPIQASSLQERIAARRTSVTDRVSVAADITPPDRPFVWWCNLNSESELLRKAIPGAVEVRGSDKDIEKERKLNAFSAGEIRVLITKPSIAGFGMNWQHCADTGFVGLNDSFEQVFQAVRRFWRFGQTRPVNVHFIASELEGAVVANILRKERQSEKMIAAMVQRTADLTSSVIHGQVRDIASYQPQEEIQIPEWLA